MAFPITETFTGTSGTVLNSYNAAWAEHGSYTGGSIIINSTGDDVRRNVGAASMFYRTDSPAGPNYRVEGDLKAYTANGGNTDFAGVAGRVDTASDTMYLAGYAGGAGDAWRLIKIVAGSQTQLASTGQSFTVNATREVALEMIGTQIEVFLDGSGSAFFSVSDSSISAAGKSGIFFSGGTTETNSAGMHITGFRAEDVVTGGFLPLFANHYRQQGIA